MIGMTTLPEHAGKIAVMVVEDQTAIRQMLVAFVRNMPGFTVVAEAGSVADALRAADETAPDVVVLDWMLAEGIGLDFLRQVRCDPPPQVLVFSANTTELAVREALGAGARGYIEKMASFSDFTAALTAVAAGETYIGPAIMQTMRRIIASPERISSSMDLSVRERDVLRFLAEGLSSKEIAERLGLSSRTVENHRASISRRTGLRSVAQLTLYAVRLGLVPIPGSEPTKP